MAQLFFIALVAVILYLLGDIIRKFLSQKYRTPQAGKSDGDIIDISNAWIDLNHLPYVAKSNILTKKEVLLYEALTDITNGKNYVVLPKPRLAEMMDLTPSAPHRAEYLRRLRERYVDFLICEGREMAPLLLILTESRGENEFRQQNRDFASRSAEAVGLSFLILSLDPIPQKTFLASQLKNAGLLIDV